MESHLDGWLFTLRAICKTVRSIGAKTITVWPYSVMFDWMWSIFTFPDDQWPDSSVNMLRCVVLNMGIYVTAILIVIVIVYGYPHISDFIHCNAIIISSLFSPGQVTLYLEHSEMKRNPFINTPDDTDNSEWREFFVPDAPPAPPPNPEPPKPPPIDRKHKHKCTKCCKCCECCKCDPDTEESNTEQVSEQVNEQL